MLTDVSEDGFGKGKSVAWLDNPTKESVQTIELPNNIKARFVTLNKDKKNAILKFREVEIYNGPLGNRRNLCVCCSIFFVCCDKTQRGFHMLMLLIALERICSS